MYTIVVQGENKVIGIYFCTLENKVALINGKTKNIHIFHKISFFSQSFSLISLMIFLSSHKSREDIFYAFRFS